MIKVRKLIILLLILIFFQSLNAQSYSDPFGHVAELMRLEKILNANYNLSPYIQERIHEMILDFIRKNELSSIYGRSEIAEGILKDVCSKLMKDKAAIFHIDREINLFENFDSAQWFQIDYKSGPEDTALYYIRSDQGFNSRNDCLVLRELQNTSNDIEECKFTFVEYRFYDNYQQCWSGRTYFVSNRGKVLYILDASSPFEDSTQFVETSNISDYYKAIINGIKAIKNNRLH